MVTSGVVTEIPIPDLDYTELLLDQVFSSQADDDSAPQISN